MDDDRLINQDLIWAPGTDHITASQMDAIRTRDANAIRPIPSQTVLGHEHLMADADRTALIAEVDRLLAERVALAEDSENATDGPWWVTEDDLIGGWCVRTIGQPPSSGRGITIADFMRREDARICATARNLTVQTEAIAGIRAALTADMAIAEDGTLYLNPRSSRYGTSGGIALTDEVVEHFADEAEQGYEPGQFKARGKEDGHAQSAFGL